MITWTAVDTPEMQLYSGHRLILTCTNDGRSQHKPEECHEAGEIGDPVWHVCVHCRVKGENPIEGLSSHQPPVELPRPDLFFEESQRVKLFLDVWTIHSGHVDAERRVRSEGRIRLTLAEGNLHKAFTFDGSLQNIRCDMVLEISAHCGEDRVCCDGGHENWRF